MNKKNIIISIILMILIWLSLAGQYVVIVNDLLQSIIMGAIDILILSLILMIIPVIFRVINNKPLSYDKGKKICVYNSIIAFIITILLNAVFDTTNYVGIGGVGALIYYFVNMSFFVESKNSINNKNLENPIRNKSNKKIIYIILPILLVLLILVLIFLTNILPDNASKEIEEETNSDEPYVIEENSVKVYRACHILVEDLETAKEIIKELNNGADFTYLAKKYSIDETAENGGDLGIFYEGEMVSEFEEAVDSLEINQYTNVPIKSDYGYHVIKRTRP